MRKKFLTITLATTLVLSTGCGILDKVLPNKHEEATEVVQEPEAEYIPVDEEGEELPRTVAQLNTLNSADYAAYNCTEVTGDQVRNAISDCIHQDCVLIIDNNGDYYTEKELKDNNSMKAVTADPECRKENDNWVNIGLVIEGDRLCTELKKNNDRVEIIMPEDKSCLVGRVTDLSALQHADSELFINGKGRYYAELIINPDTGSYQGIIFSKVS